MAKRPGRKRKENVERYPNGQPKKQETLILPYNTAGVIVTGDERDGNTRGLMRVQSPLDVLNITKAQKLAGEELIRLKDQCRRYALGTPSLYAKISDPNRGHSHEGDQADNIVSLGKDLMKKYAKAVDVLVNCGKLVAPIVSAVCFENKMPTSEDRPKLYKGLKALADHWKF